MDAREGHAVRDRIKTIAGYIAFSHRVTGRMTFAALGLLALGTAWCLLAGFVDLRIVYDALGGGWVGAAGIASGIILAPLTYGVAPLYALFIWADPMPLLFTIAGTGVLALLAPHISVRASRLSR